jgi:hypothetical protein
MDRVDLSRHEGRQPIGSGADGKTLLPTERTSKEHDHRRRNAEDVNRALKSRNEGGCQIPVRLKPLALTLEIGSRRHRRRDGPHRAGRRSNPRHGGMFAPAMSPCTESCMMPRSGSGADAPNNPPLRIRRTSLLAVRADVNLDVFLSYIAE